MRYLSWGWSLLLAWPKIWGQGSRLPMYLGHLNSATVVEPQTCIWFLVVATVPKYSEQLVKQGCGRPFALSSKR